ncbi:interleukin-5 receptor subunit alpha [Rhinatrema bivittatum]|uniref:interleukin-5 receptor subunit alpha n=1 Tax=Rhinatrema bivittatum TaxID=194408 RepID=UPI001128F1C3|nr:interleukin-5 receptor subunit alpha [Rhinatrema bivittatum]
MALAGTRTIFLIVIGISSALNNVQVLQPADLSISVPRLGEVLLSWKPNPIPDPETYLVKYNVVIKTPMQEEQYTTRHTKTKRTIALHRGLSAQICAVYYHRGKELARSQWAHVELPPPPGSEGTSITNLSCVVYAEVSNKVALDCCWLAGQEAPEDIQYFLFYRYKMYLEECQEYHMDQDEKRHTGCHFSNTHINIMKGSNIVIYINGSSKSSIIKPFDQLFDPNNIERINPPMNVTVLVKKDTLYVQWMKPISLLPNPCFLYEINISECLTGNSKLLRVEAVSMQIPMDSSGRHSVQVRAGGRELCGKSKQWSAWSQPVYTEEPQLSSVVLRLSLFHGALAVVILLCAVLCMRFQLCGRLFPQVPAPRNPFKDLLTDNEEPKEGELEVISYVEVLDSDVRAE